MARRKIKAGTTSVSIPVFVQDTTSTTGAGLAITAATAGLTCKYRRHGSAASTTVALSAGTLGTWASGTIVAGDGPVGDYELSLPDAAFASGVRWVTVWLYGAANMLPVRLEIELDAVDYQDAAAFGLSRLDAAVSSRSTLTAGGVRTELSTELGRIDAAVSSRSSHSAADVWASPARTLTSFGTLVADVAAAVWASVSRTLTDISDSSGVTTLLSRLTALRAGYLDYLVGIKAKTDTIGSSAVLVNTPVSIDGTVTVVQGRSYKTANGGQQITVSISGIDLTGATVALLDELGASLDAGSVTDPGGTDQSVTFELDDAQTALMACGEKRWEIVATIGGEPVHVAWLGVTVERRP